jgi:hypothetical protein
VIDLLKYILEFFLHLFLGLVPQVIVLSQTQTLLSKYFFDLNSGQEPVVVFVHNFETLNDFIEQSLVVQTPSIINELLWNQNEKFSEVDSSTAVFIDYWCEYLELLFGRIMAQRSKDGFKLLNKSKITLLLMQPSPSLSKSAKAYLNSSICS